MMVKWIGAMLVVAGCGGVGYSMAAAHRREEQTLRQLIGALDYIACELQYHMTPLPDLCHQAGMESRGCIRQVFVMLSQELERKLSPDAAESMQCVLGQCGDIPPRTGQALRLLGSSLGRFDAEGQIRGLEAVRGFCRQELDGLAQNRENRLRGYQTLGLCAGAALAILFV